MTECEHKGLQDFIHPFELVGIKDRYALTPVPFNYITRSCVDCGKEINRWKCYMTGDLVEVDVESKS